MSETVWYRYGLRADLYVTIQFDGRPTAEDLSFLAEYLALHQRVLAAAEARRAQAEEEEHALPDPYGEPGPDRRHPAPLGPALDQHGDVQGTDDRRGASDNLAADPAARAALTAGRA